MITGYEELEIEEKQTEEIKPQEIKEIKKEVVYD